MSMRVAVLVRERQAEGLRVALGMTLAGPEVEVYVLDRPLELGPEGREHLAALLDLGMPVATNVAGADLPLVADAAIARRLLACERVVAL
jgi:hypothetical protein